MANQVDKADPSWHREVVQVLGLDMKCCQPLPWQPAIVQVFVLKQMAVSAGGKNADLRYNNHSPDFDETQHMQNEKYWKYLYPVWLDNEKHYYTTSTASNRSYHSLFHFPEKSAPSSLTLWGVAKTVEEKMNKLINVHQRWQTNNHLLETDYQMLPTFNNVDCHCDMKRKLRAAGYGWAKRCCKVCVPRQISKQGLETIKRLWHLLNRVCQLARAITIKSLKKYKPTWNDVMIERVWKTLTYREEVELVHDYTEEDDDFVDSEQREMFADICHHVYAIQYRFGVHLLGRSSRQHFNHDPNVYEHFHAMLCCRVSKFTRVKFHSLPQCMRERCVINSDDSQAHQLLPLSANMKIIEKCVNLFYVRENKTSDDMILHDRRVARIVAANKKRFIRAEKRINDERCWINYPMKMTKFWLVGHVERANEIERFSTYRHKRV